MDVDTTKFNDKYFPRVDLSDKNRYQYYKHNRKEYAYDKKYSELITLFKDPDEGKDAPYRNLSSVGFNYMNWTDKEVRDEYLDEYEAELNDEMDYITQDFVQNELPLYQNKKESVETNEQLQINLESIDTIKCNGLTVGQSVSCTLDDGPDGKHTYAGTVTEIYPDHIILDINGISDHCWYDDDMADSITIEDKDPETGKEILNEEDEYYIDTKGIMGNPNETYTISDLKDYWRSEYTSKDPDPTLLACGGSFDEWLADMLEAMDGPYDRLDEEDEELELNIEDEALTTSEDVSTSYLDQIKAYVGNEGNVYQESIILPWFGFKITDARNASALANKLKRMPLVYRKSAKVSIIAYPNKVIVIRWRESDRVTESRDTKENSNKKFLVKYINNNDNSAEDIVNAKNETDAKKQVKPRALRILSIKEMTD